MKLQHIKDLLQLKTLYSRLTVAFALVMLLLVSVQFYILFQFFLNTELARIQRTNWSLAEDFARFLLPQIERGTDENELAQAIWKLQDLNKEVDIYILNKDGRIIFPPTPDTDTVVPPELIESFLIARPVRRWLIRGPSPRVRDREFIFSAARFAWPYDQPAYLYVILQGGRSLHYWSVLFDWHLILGGALTSALIAGSSLALGCYIFLLLTRRFRLLAESVRRISEGDFSARADLHGSDEMAELARQVNHMAETIEQSIRTVKHVDQLRRELVANLSHDLRSPVTSLKGYLDTCIERFATYSESEKMDRLQILAKNIDLMAGMIDQLFELARLDANEIVPEKEPFSLSELVSEGVIACYQPLALEKEVALRADPDTQLPFVYADAKMVYRILANLVSNALRYTPPHGSVEIKLERIEEKIRVSVVDSGPGIPEEDLPRIFDRLYVGNTARTKGLSGAGLGLAVVKHMLEAHGEQIQVRSSVNEGSIFFFDLPVFEFD